MCISFLSSCFVWWTLLICVAKYRWYVLKQYSSNKIKWKYILYKFFDVLSFIYQFNFHCFKINPFSYPKIQKWRTQTSKRNKILSNHATFFLTTGSLRFALARAKLMMIWRILMRKTTTRKSQFWEEKNTFFSVKSKHRSFLLKVNYKPAN